jgi:hypothetical protein
MFGRRAAPMRSAAKSLLLTFTYILIWSSFRARQSAGRRVMNAIKLTLITALIFVGSVFAQTTPATAASPELAKKWLEKEKFGVLWSLQGSRDQSFTAFPVSKKFSFNSSDYCESGQSAADYAVEEGKLVITVTRTRPGCGVVWMRFDLSTLEGDVGMVTSGQREVLPGRVVRLKE